MASNQMPWKTVLRQQVASGQQPNLKAHRQSPSKQSPDKKQVQLQQINAQSTLAGISLKQGAKNFILPGKSSEGGKRVTVMKTHKLKSSMIKFSPSPSPSPPPHNDKSPKLVKQKFVVSKRISPCSIGSGSSVEDESTAGAAKIGVQSTQVLQGASQSYLTNRAPAHQASQVIKIINRKSPSPPKASGGVLPKKFFRLGSKNGVIRLSPSPPPSNNHTGSAQAGNPQSQSQANFHSSGSGGASGGHRTKGSGQFVISLQNKAIRTSASKKTSSQQQQSSQKNEPSPPPALEASKSKPTLATDFIKQMLSKNRSPKHSTAQITNVQQLQQRKKAAQSGITISSNKAALASNHEALPRQSRNQQHQVRMQQESQKSLFAEEMTRHGIMGDLVKVFDTSPSRTDQPNEGGSATTASVLPNSSQQAHQYYTNAALSSIKVPLTLAKRAASPPLPSLGPTPGGATTSSSSQQAEQKITNSATAQKQGDNKDNPNASKVQKSTFQFPFQRRARSLSLTKQEEIEKKLKQQQQQQQAAPSEYESAKAAATAASNGKQAHQQRRQSPGAHSPAEEMLANLVYQSNVTTTSQNNFASLLRGSSATGNLLEQSSSSLHPTTSGSKSKVQPIVAKTDFSLQQQMMGIGRCKDLDEWLVGSGESAETADSKKATHAGPPGTLLSSQQAHAEAVAGLRGHGEGDNGGGLDDHVMDSPGKVEADWMFQTFDQQKKPSGKKASKAKQSEADGLTSGRAVGTGSTKKQKLALDPFMNIDENQGDDDEVEQEEEDGFGAEDDDMMLDGGMHLMMRVNSKRGGAGHATNCDSASVFDQFMGGGVGCLQNEQQLGPPSLFGAKDCVTQVASECIDLNQFISKMDQLVYSQHGRRSASLASQ